MIHRILTSFLLERLKQRPAVALLGSRQVGKTTLAMQLVNQIQQPSIYIDLESPADRTKLLDAESYLLQRSDQFVIIDEVQRMPELFPILRSVIDKDRRNGRYLLLGSASPTLIKDSSETLAGRIDYLELSPLTFPEVTNRGDMQTLWLRGGFPESFLAADDRTSFLNRTSFLRTYIERELPLLGFTSSQRRIADILVRMIAHVHGNLINYADLSRSTGVGQQRIKDIIAYFNQSFLIRLLAPYHTNSGKRLVKTPKIFFQDSGLFHNMAGIETMEELESFDRKGASWEGFVVQQVIALLSPTITPYFYRTQDGAELDLLLLKGNKPVLALEIKYNNAPSVHKGTTTALADLGNIPCLMVTPSISEDYNMRPNQLVTAFNRLFQHPALIPYLLPF